MNKKTLLLSTVLLFSPFIIRGMEMGSIELDLETGLLEADLAENKEHAIVSSNKQSLQKSHFGLRRVLFIIHSQFKKTWGFLAHNSDLFARIEKLPPEIQEKIGEYALVNALASAEQILEERRKKIKERQMCCIISITWSLGLGGFFLWGILTNGGEKY